MERQMRFSCCLVLLEWNRWALSFLQLNDARDLARDGLG
jgi:hypothetical protein